MTKKVEVRGLIQHLPTPESGRKITPAINGQQVFDLFVETKPAAKAGPVPAGDSKKEKPKKEKVFPVICPDCLEQTLYISKKGPFCTQCSHQ